MLNTKQLLKLDEDALKKKTTTTLKRKFKELSEK